MYGFEVLNSVSLPEVQVGILGRTVDTAREITTHNQPVVASHRRSGDVRVQNFKSGNLPLVNPPVVPPASGAPGATAPQYLYTICH